VRASSAECTGLSVDDKLKKAIGYSKKLKHGFEAWDTNPLGFLLRHYKVGGINTWC
jgi:hypothetical protein